ncbi:MAG TPA: DUF1972 domain-containing protein [Bacteroidales bacterium]|nr:DUF1972 domain-containing protein [Bacteroidales bacterium]
MEKSNRISIIGTRGIPSVYGGFETFAEEISVLLTRAGYDVTVQCDKDSCAGDTFRGVKLYISRYSKNRNPVLYYYDGIRWATRYTDIIVIAGSAGSPFYILNLFRKKVLITNVDGIEYRRSKWTRYKKLYLFLTELISVVSRGIIIADSSAIRDHLVKRYGKMVSRKIRVIEYGAYPNNKVNEKILSGFSLVSFKYYLVVCRLEPENNVDMIINGYLLSGTKLPLVIVGNLLDNPYVRKLTQTDRSGRVVFLGGIYDKEALMALRSGCYAYIHGHSVGGTNPSLLEAMANGNIALCHDNVFNREVTGEKQFYFSDSWSCSDQIIRIEAMKDDELDQYHKASSSMILDKYSWDKILEKYCNLFDSVLP